LTGQYCPVFMESHLTMRTRVTDQEVEYQEIFVYQLEAFDLSPLTDWHVNDTMHFAINKDGIITNNSLLELGIYGLQVNVSDGHGNILEGEFSVTVYDGTTPSINHPGDIQYEVGETGFSITWIPADDYPERYEILQNGTVISSGDWNTTGEDINITVDGLVIGTYNYTIVVYDQAGNYVSDIVIVRVLPESTTTTTTTTTGTTTITTTATTSISTTPTTSTSPTGTILPLDSLFIIIIIGGLVAGLVIIVIVLKKRP
jgi:hypothetical protein